MSKHLLLSVVLAGVASAAATTAPMVHPQNSAGRLIPITVLNQDTGESVRVDRDEAYNFDGSTQGWASYGTGLQNDTWHVEPVGHGGTYTNTWWSASAAVGGYLSSSFVYLQTPAINLVGAVSPNLAFNLFYACETPGGEPAGYNGWDGCNVWASIDGGNTWSVLSGTPAYNVSSSFAFGDEFGMGTGVAAWGGTAAGWAPASISLASLVGQSDVRLRFVMCADPAFDHVDDPNMIGMQVDNIVVSAGGTLWADDGVSNTGGAPTHNFYVYGNSWAHTGAEWVCANDPSLGCYVESPWISYAPPAIIEVQQDIRLDLPDSDGNDDGFLEDYFYIEYTADGTTWTTLTYDYFGGTRPFISTGYVLYTNADVFNGSLRFTRSAGSQVKLRYRMRTDGDNDGGQGTGLWVDNVNVTVETVPANDLAITKFWLPYPRNISVTQYPSAEISNEGAAQQVNIRASWRIYNDSTNVLVKAATPMNNTAATIDPLTKVRVTQTSSAPGTWKWTPAIADAYRIQCYTTLSTDADRSNDTLDVVANIFAPNVGFLKYDYNTSSAWTLAQNNGEDGALVRFDPIAQPWTVEWFFARLYNVVAGDQVTLVIHDQGVDNATPGALLGQYTATVNGPEDVYPNTFIRYIGTIDELRCINHPVWVGLRTNTHNATGIVGLSGENGGPYWEQHSYGYDYLANTAYAWNGDVQMWLQVDWGVESEIPFTIELTGVRTSSSYTLNWDSPGPVDGYKIYRSADGYFTPGTEVATVPAGTTTWTDTIAPTARNFYKVVGYNGVCPAN
jgi:hypothetical protein